MPVESEIQCQLFKCLMIKELKSGSKDAFVIDINGTELRFTLFDFALITGLKCYGEEIEFPDVKNKFMTKYSPGATKNVLKMSLNKYFEDRDWGVGANADRDAVRIVILYFIHNYLLSSEKRNVTVPKKYFDLVVSGRYVDYTWGKEAFDDLIVSVHNRMQNILRFYCLRGFPYAMQVWIYECCSNVDPNLAVKTPIPRMFNWKTINTQPTVFLLMSGMFREETEDEYVDFSTAPPHVAAVKEKERKIASKSPPRKKSRKMSTAPLPEENRQSTVQQTVIPLSVPTRVSVPVQPVQSKGKETVGTITHHASVDDSSTNRSDDIKSLREDFNKFKQDVVDALKSVFTELKDFRLAMDEKLTKLLKNKKLNQNSEKGADSETHAQFRDENIPHAGDAYMDHDDGIQMDTTTIHVSFPEGDRHEKQADNGNGSDDTVKVSTEEILEEGDLSGEQKISDECPC
ncbi:uncharacterized protein LOC132048708 [Lycium ferocissimum]|uniref:uncharacterized protein LOC132048708 n=1 Tax=Lycium ferocissimum TaxID=112874 RepID=UPI00281575A1|nr:uncharacterized protein LOC132048708 [Lycium ferocissimum]